MDNKTYKKIYKLLENVTPLKADCGQLCDKKCCHGDSGTGMLLFPYEETTLTVIEQNGRRLAVCDGTCNRNERPLSCRIFPFFPVTYDKKITVKPDLRGINICPMIAHSNEIIFNKRFLRRVKKTGKLLLKNPECAKFIEEISEEISEIEKINEMISET